MDKTMLRTRLLESEEIVCNAVSLCEVLDTKDNSLLLKTHAVSKRRKAIGSTDSGMARVATLVEEGTSIGGRLRIDALSDTIIRFRYTEGETELVNSTPMVVGALDGPKSCQVSFNGESAQISTAAAQIKIDLARLRIDIQNHGGEKICGISGPERNSFVVWDSFETGVCRSQHDGSPISVEKFDLHPHEAIFGLGEKFMPLNKVGQTIDLNMTEAHGVTTPRSYKNIPFFVSTKGYGVFFNHSSRITFWVGSMSTADIQIATEDDFLDYYVILGDIKQLLSQYTDITGKGVVPPKWTFGYWQSKISYKSAEETLDIAQKLRENKIPCDVIHLDTHWFKKEWLCDLEFDKVRFPDPEAYMTELAKMGFNISLWQLPYIAEGSQLFDELKAVDGFVKNKEGGLYDIRCGFNFFPPGTRISCIDFTNPKAVQIYQKWLRKLFKLGAKVIKTDFGEDAPVDGIYYDGTPGYQMHNLYPLLYNRAVAEVTKEETGDIVVWGRSAWAGCQRYPLQWGGDSSPNWANMVPQLEGGLSFGLSGFQFWSQDIGGFLGQTGGNLLIRWMQMGMFLSHSRIHGSGDRELYKFEPEVLRICRNYINLRYQLMPYIYGSAFSCVEQSLPMARALVVDYQNDPTVWNISDEYLFGDSILVAPITDPSNKRAVYLPEGTWTDWWTGEQLEGRRWIDIEADIETLPLYVREGAIIPVGPVMQYVNELRVEEIELRIAPIKGEGKSSFTVPVNDEKVAVEYLVAGGRHTVKIGDSKVRFNITVLGNRGVDISPAGL
ncbi:hypothetical protein ES707_07041 [subsurface metagenome]